MSQTDLVVSAVTLCEVLWEGFFFFFKVAACFNRFWKNGGMSPPTVEIQNFKRL